MKKGTQMNEKRVAGPARQAWQAATSTDSVMISFATSPDAWVSIDPDPEDENGCCRLPKAKKTSDETELK